MPITNTALRTTMSMFRASDPSGAYHACFAALETYLLRVSAEERGLLVPPDVLQWIHSSKPTPDAIRFALWAIGPEGRPRTSMPIFPVPDHPAGLWGWVSLYRLKPDWHEHFAALGKSDEQWGTVLRNWAELEVIAREWETADARAERPRLLATALRLMGAPVPTEHLLPPPPAFAPPAAARFAVTRPTPPASPVAPAASETAALSIRDPAQLGAALAAHLTRHLETVLQDRETHLEGRLVGKVTHVLQDHQKLLHANLAAQREVEVQALNEALAAQDREREIRLEKRLRALGIYEPTYGAAFPIGE